MKSPSVYSKIAVTAGLIGAMGASGVLAPFSAVAATMPAAGDAPSIREAAGARFSDATLKLIAAAEGSAKMSVDEAKRLLDQVEAEASAAQEADQSQARAVEGARESVSRLQADADDAGAAVDAELEAQVASLNRELSDAQLDLDQLKAQKEDAETALEELNGQVGEARSQVDAKTTALAEAQARLDKAQKDLEELGEAPAAKAQEAYDEAKEAYDGALADQQQKQQEADEAKALLDGLESQLAAKKGEQQQAAADVVAAQAEKERADAALESAKEGYASAVEALKEDAMAPAASRLASAEAWVSSAEQGVSSAQARLEAAQAAFAALAPGDPGYADAQQELSDAEGEARSAQEELDGANGELSSARAAYDQAVASAGAEAQAEASSDIAAKQAAADEASADLRYAQGRVEAIPGEIEDLETQISDQDARLTQAQGEADAAKRDLAAAEKDRDEKKAALQDLVSAQDRWDQRNKELSKTISDAQSAWEAADRELQDAQEELDGLTAQQKGIQEQIDACEQQLAASMKRTMFDFTDFLEWYDSVYNTDHSYIRNLLTGEGGPRYQYQLNDGTLLSDSTVLGAEGDATYLDNVVRALQIVEATNELREQAGLSPLEVSTDLMVASMLDTNWSSSRFAHAGNNMSSENPYGLGVAENLAWNSSAEFAVGQWYSERGAWEDFCKENGLTSTDGTAGQIWNEHFADRYFSGDPVVSAAYSDFGHYINLMDNTSRYAGVAVATATGDMSRYGLTFGEVFSGSPSILLGDSTFTQSGETFTPAALLNLINQGINATMQGDETLEGKIDELRGQLAGLDGDLTAARQLVEGKKALRDGAEATIDEAEKDLEDLGSRPTTGSVESDFQAAQQAFEEAESAYKQADANCAEVARDVDARKAELGKRKAELESELSGYDIDGLQAAYDQAKADLDSVRASYDDLFSTASDLDSAREDARKAAGELSSATDLSESLSLEIDDLGTQIDGARGTFEELRLEAAAAGPTKAQQEALSEADAKLKEANAFRDGLAAKRDGEKSNADRALSEERAATERLNLIESQIKENEGLRDAAADALPAAGDRVDRWTAIFAEQDPRSLVVDGFRGQVEDDDIAGALAEAHAAYQSKVERRDKAEADLAAAREALEATLAAKESTEGELAERLADLAAAQEAYDKIVAASGQGNGAQGPAVQQASARKPADEGSASGSDLPQTGDASGIAALGMALAGFASAALGSRFRRRDE